MHVVRAGLLGLADGDVLGLAVGRDVGLALALVLREPALLGLGVHRLQLRRALLQHQPQEQQPNPKKKLNLQFSLQRQAIKKLM